MPCCKDSFIFEGTSVPAENACMYAAQDGLLSSDFTAEPFLKHFFDRNELSIVQIAHSCEVAKLELPSMFEGESYQPDWLPLTR